MAGGSLPSIPITCRDLRGPEDPPQFSFDRAFYVAASRSPTNTTANPDRCHGWRPTPRNTAAACPGWARLEGDGPALPGFRINGTKEGCSRLSGRSPRS
jgi:hypothetical protein